MKQFNLVVAGGTFDHFHKGHKEFLQFILSCSKRVVLGLTSDQYVEHTRQTSIENYSQRKQALEKFLETQKARSRVEIASIDTLFIPKHWEKLPLEAIVVSKDTKLGADEINKRRRRQGLTPLEILIAPLLKGQDGNIISSTRIRNGEINREGKPFIDPMWLTRTLQITEELRRQLKLPFGLLIKDFISWKNTNPLSQSLVITVGDVVTKSVNDLSIKNKISIVDFYVERKKTFSSLSELGFSNKETVFTVDNPRGSLTPELFQVAQKIFNLSKQKRIVVKVNGEEDLAVLPMILAAPLGFIILYGQPHEGVVLIHITEEQKERAYKITCQFSTRGY